MAMRAAETRFVRKPAASPMLQQMATVKVTSVRLTAFCEVKFIIARNSNRTVAFSTGPGCRYVLLLACRATGARHALNELHRYAHLPAHACNDKYVTYVIWSSASRSNDPVHNQVASRSPALRLRDKSWDVPASWRKCPPDPSMFAVRRRRRRWRHEAATLRRDVVPDAKPRGPAQRLQQHLSNIAQSVCGGSPDPTGRLSVHRYPVSLCRWDRPSVRQTVAESITVKNGGDGRRIGSTVSVTDRRTGRQLQLTDCRWLCRGVGHPRRLLVRPYAAWDVQSDWTAELPAECHTWTARVRCYSGPNRLDRLTNRPKRFSRRVTALYSRRSNAAADNEHHEMLQGWEPATCGICTHCRTPTKATRNDWLFL